MTLHDYQQRIVFFLAMHPKAILSVDMGLGKTAATLHWLQGLEPSTALIVAPKRVAETTWKQEAEKWGLPIADRMVIVAGDAKKRKAALEDDKHPYKVISRDNLKSVLNQTYEALVVDELTSFKSISSARTKALLSIEAKYRIGLTGTFLANGAIDIFGQAAVCGLSFLQDNFYSWRANNFRDILKGSGCSFEKWRPTKPLEKILDPIADDIFTLTAEDYLKIPPVTETIHPIDVGKEIRKAIMDLDSFLCADLDGTTVTFSENQKFPKLQTLCNGFVYTDDEQVVRSAESTKLKAVVDFCEECKDAGEPVLLFYAFKEEEKWMVEMMKERKIKVGSVREKGFLDKWNDHEYDVLFAHPASAGHGLNLQNGGRIIVWSTLTYNYEYYAQANARLARQGQKRNVQIHYFVTENTVEERVVKALQKKDQEQKEFLKLTKQ